MPDHKMASRSQEREKWRPLLTILNDHDMRLTSVSIQVAQSSCAGELALLHGRLFDPGWKEASLCALLGGPASLALVAREALAGKPIGLVIGQIAADEAEILTLGVEKDWRRRGIGRLLMQSFLDIARQNGAGLFFLEVAGSNRAAISLYADLGFLRTGSRAAYYARSDGKREDAIVLSLKIQAP